jgi:formylglycine-generating enzyme required for sulfatase activity
VDKGECAVPSCEWNPHLNSELPVVCVTWAQSLAYCRFRGGRLPTEAEWEKAARGADARPYPWGEAPATCQLANIPGCVGHSMRVDSYPEGASPYGVTNMAGNVAEWVHDWYEDTAYLAQDPSNNPRGPATGKVRVRRGGSFSSVATEVDGFHVATRNYADPNGASPELGFRCVYDAARRTD